MCQNEGVCSLVGDGFKCDCVGDFFGQYCQLRRLNSTIFKDSAILTNEQGLDLVDLIGLNNSSFKLLYQLSVDGSNTKIFHSKCDEAAATLTVIKTQNSNIFGGYTAADWSGSAIKYDSTAFLFSLVNSYNLPVKMNHVNRVGIYWAIYCDPYYGIIFGAGNDLVCYNYSNDCNSNLGYSYQLPSFLNATYNSEAAQCFLAGSFRFVPVEMEIYSVQF